MANREWYYVKDGTRQGPVAEQELTKLLTEGALLPSALVWTEGAEDWRPASDVPELTQPAPQTAAPPPISEATTQPPRPKIDPETPA